MVGNRSDALRRVAALGYKGVFGPVPHACNQSRKARDPGTLRDGNVARLVAPECREAAILLKAGLSRRIGQYLLVGDVPILGAEHSMHPVGRSERARPAPLRRTTITALDAGSVS
jgi:hypothetical protein